MQNYKKKSTRTTQSNKSLKIKEHKLHQETYRPEKHLFQYYPLQFHNNLISISKPTSKKEQCKRSKSIGKSYDPKGMVFSTCFYVYVK